MQGVGGDDPAAQGEMVQEFWATGISLVLSLRRACTSVS